MQISNNPLVSVIIPNYNHARYLGERIESVLQQTYQNFEVIILDDCSPDGGASKTVIEQYREHPHVSNIIYNEENSGSTFKQWEKGISLAKGELVWIAESDDKCLPTLLDKLVGQFVKDENLALAFCKTVAFDDNGKEERLDPIPLSKSKTFGSTEFISHHMIHGCPIINASACLFKKEIALRIDKLYNEFRGAGDRMFWTEISEFGDVAVVNEWLNYMRLHQSNSTKKYNHDGTNQREDKRVLDYIHDKGYISAKIYQELKHHYVKIHIFEMLTDKDLKKDLYAEWEFNKWNQFCLRLEAWFHKIIISKYSSFY